jgi:septal ring factor EnvC (AmiA/AmiB activator)
MPEQTRNRRRLSRRAAWRMGLSAAVLFAASLSYLICDHVRARDQFGEARSSLGVTRHHTSDVSAQLAGLRRDLQLLTTQVGNGATALNQDASQLTGTEASLTAAQTQVSQQATLINSLQGCLGGVERALNALSVDDRTSAIAALKSVSTSCSTASASSG